MQDRAWPRISFFPLALAGLVVAGALAFNLVRPPFDAQGARLNQATQAVAKARESYGQGDWPQVKSYASQALALNPTQLTARLLLGLALMNLNTLDEAEAEFRQVLALAKDDRNSEAWAHNNLGVVFQRRGQLREAIQEYETALGLDPSVEQARANLAAVQRYLP